MDDLFESMARHARAQGDRTALARRRTGGEYVETSFRELHRRACGLRSLIAERVPEETLVPVLAGRSASSVAAMLAAVGSGRPFSFINPKLRGPQIAAVLEASGAPLAVVDEMGLIALRGAGREHRSIRETTWVVLDPEELSSLAAAAARALAETTTVIGWSFDGGADGGSSLRAHAEIGACLFTSGSSGTPKGVLIDRQDLLRRTVAEIEWFGLRGDDVLLSVLPFSFDVGLNQLMAALAVGSELVLLDSWLPADILSVVEARGVSGISGVPAIWKDLLRAEARFDKPGRHGSLRYLTVSGGSLPPEQILDLAARAPDVEIFKTYGQTEAFRATSLRPEDLYRHVESVGRPFAGVRVYVVREDGTRCAPGEVGEVVHSGLGIMRGYLGEPAGARSGLRANPFAGPDDPSPMAVFTGDMGYLDEDGYLYLRGRRDGMLKVMGNRVYPQEVEAQVARVPGIAEAAVTLRTDGDGERLCAFVAPAAGAELTVGELRRALHKRLPPYMVPQEIVLVEQIPRTHSGKPDTIALQEAVLAS